MEKEIIESITAGLPHSELGKIQQDHEIWEETDGGAHFKVTRHWLPTPYKLEMISMSVSGLPSERSRIITEFSQALGIPADSQDVNLNIAEHIDIVAWLVKQPSNNQIAITKENRDHDDL